MTRIHGQMASSGPSSIEQGKSLLSIFDETAAKGEDALKALVTVHIREGSKIIRVLSPVESALSGVAHYDLKARAAKFATPANRPVSGRA